MTRRRRGRAPLKGQMTLFDRDRAGPSGIPDVRPPFEPGFFLGGRPVSREEVSRIVGPKYAHVVSGGHKLEAT